MTTRLAAFLVGLTVALQPPAGPPKSTPPAGQVQPPQGQEQLPQTQKVPGLEIVVERDRNAQPDSQPTYQIDRREGFINVRARPTPWQGPPAVDKPTLKRVRWVVISTGQQQPKVNEDLNPENSVITVGLPEPKDSLFIAACAMIDAGGKADVTDHASILVAISSADGLPGQPAPMAQGTNQPPAAVPGSARGLSVIVVCQTRTPEFQAIAQSANVKASLAQSGSKLYVMDVAEAGRRPGNDVAPLVQPVGVPAVIVVGPDRKRILPAGAAQRLNVLAFDGRNNAEIARRNELILLDMVGRAAGGR